MDSLEDYKKRCHFQWEKDVCYRIRMALLLEDKKSNGLKTNKLKELTELPENLFKKAISFLTRTEKVIFKETDKGRDYFLPDESRKTLSAIYNPL